jgi:serine/threonine protein kinase
VIDQLGAGGMGAVFRVHDEVLHREVALKQLLAAPIAESKRKLITALFEREYHTLVRLKHPRIIEVYDFGVSEDGPYYTMQ